MCFLDISSSLWQFDLKYFRKYGAVCGVDEVGRGPLAGPLVAAAVLWEGPPNPSCPVNDSKALSFRSRLPLYRQIMQAASACGIGIATPGEIALYSTHGATFLAMRRALESLGICPIIVLVDGKWEIPGDFSFKQKAIIKGDAMSASVASASIIAKVIRDELMIALDRIYPGYGFAVHKGYATKRHLLALQELGPCRAHRPSFRHIRDADGR